MPYKDLEKQKKYKKEYREKNLEKMKEKAKEYNKINQKRFAFDRVLASYNLSLEQYTEMYNKQKGLCVLCGTFIEMVGTQVKKSSIAHVDHCHTTGKVRGLLCTDCNLGLGRFKDNPEILLKAIGYLTGI